MRALLALLLLLGTGLAGCSDGGSPGDGGPATGDGGAGTGPAVAEIAAPEWQVGDFWTLESPQQESGPFTHVVSGDAGDDWVVDTDSRDTAYFDARFDISFLGKVRKSDLAGSQGSARVEFLRFPLRQDLNWTTTWDGEAMALHAADVRDGRATIQARRADGTLYADYTYDSRAGYFSRFAFYAPDGTTVGFEWALRTSGSGHSGPLVRWTLDELFASAGPLPTGESSTFQVAPGYTDIWVDGLVECSAGALFFAIGPPQGPAEERGYSAYGACPYTQTSQYSVPAPAAAEQWGAVLTSAPSSAGTFHVGIFGRTLTEFTAGDAPS